MRQTTEHRTQSTDNRRQRKEKRGLFCVLCSVLCILYSVFCVLLLSGCTRPDKIYKESRVLMYTICTITVVSSSEEKAREAIEAAFDEIKRLEWLLDYYSPESEITAINKAAGKFPVRVSKETLDIIKKSVYIAEVTDGAFNPTIGPVMKLWGFSRQRQGHSLPSRKEIDRALRLIDYRKIRIDEARSEILLEKEGMEINLGGIAKGYAADRAIDVIKEKGIKAALVAIAGDIKGFGLKPNAEPWKVGIQDPRPHKKTADGNPSKEIFASLDLRDRAISTSGDYQRFFVEGGKRYHHIIDPETGYPAMSQVISASVIADEGYMADGLSTGVFVLGPEKGIALLESMGLDGVIVDSERNVYITQNLKGRINLKKHLKD